MADRSAALYVTDTRHGHHAWHDPSARHRCYHFADALVQEGWSASVVHIDSLTASIIGRFRHVIFHRPKYSPRFARALAICRRCDVSVHADYDDLIFDPELAEHSPLFINGNRPLSKVKRYFEDNRSAMENFDSIIVSTSALCKHLRRQLPHVNASVLPNSLPRLFQPPRVQPPRVQPPHLDKPQVERSRDCSFVIGYFPGSNSHNHDIEMVFDALGQLLTDKPHCRLVVVGKMADKRLSSLSRQVEFKPFVDYNQYLYQLAQVDLSIAPLQKNIFNDSKSAVKLIESVAVGTPILASENPDMADHMNSMSVLVRDASDWLAKLLQCIERNACFDCSASEQLRVRYSVSSRLPILQQHLNFSV